MTNHSNGQEKVSSLSSFWSIIIAFVIQAACFTVLSARGNCPPLGQRLTAEQYCKLYADEAQRQMKLYGIPASITLAQGMYESGYASSYLAVKANNHFGIKAYRGWSGPVVRCDDDAANEPFCKFKNVMEGYEYHSQFLKNNSRYAPLFKLNVRDYEGWAKGLSKCGYATDPRYATKIIEIIERYHLDVYDSNKKGKSSTGVSHQMMVTAKRRGLKYVRANAGDDLSQIAKEFNVSTRRLRNWNDMPKDYQLHEGEIVYLQSKRSRAAKNHPEHIVKAGESLHIIAQTYGVTVKSIMKRNKLESGAVFAGQKLKLR